MLNDMQIAISQMQGRVPVTVFHIKGQIDANTSKNLEAKAAEAVGSGTHDLLLDLSDVTYMSSAGFRAVHSIYTMLNGDEQKGGQQISHLKLLNPSEDINRIIWTLGFNAFVSTHSDLKAAVGAF
jgi:anti-anti-sigma factor